MLGLGWRRGLCGARLRAGPRRAARALLARDLAAASEGGGFSPMSVSAQEALLRQQIERPSLRVRIYDWAHRIALYSMMAFIGYMGTFIGVEVSDTIKTRTENWQLSLLRFREQERTIAAKDVPPGEWMQDPREQHYRRV